jgi:hypothetical protein
MNLLTKKYGAKYVLPIAMLIFGSMAMISAACTTFGGKVASTIYRYMLKILQASLPHAGF